MKPENVRQTLKPFPKLGRFLIARLITFCEGIEQKPTLVSEDGLNESAWRFMPLVDELTPVQQGLLLSQLRAWNEQDQRQTPAD